MGLQASGGIHEEEDQIDDLCASNDGPDQRSMARTVHKGDLKCFARDGGEGGGEGGEEKGGETQVKGDAPLLGLRVFVEGGRRKVVGE